MKQTVEDKVPLLSNSDQQQGEEMKGQGDIEKGVLAEPKNPFSPLAWKSLLGLGVFIYASYTILVHLCEVDGKLPFSTASMVLSIEVLKITISITALLPEIKENGFPRPTLSYVMLFAVPAILYALNNNISAHMQLQMDPATYQVLGNLKILSTAFLYRLIIKRPITGVQWVSLGLLATAGICNSYGGFQAKADEKSAGEIHITMKGLIMISIYCFISGLAGVYTEYILKRHYQTSIHLQNTLLYTFGIVLNGSAFVIQALTSGDKDAGFNPFHGYTIYTVLLIMSQAFCGLLMSAIFKHGNNITRLFIISCAMLVTTVLSIVIFGLKLNLFFCASFGLVISALVLYHRT
ncbi:unnamed protein product [Owenia fusiformis]|uniref:UDP-sugar transporter protein SLC35A4 n=1 Tax=Owenia fusiformis TaxID=6347 RepID=A0A8S4PXA9_OWEFU|nr:unnamed protein product [Owenia fusiformis]